MVWHTAANWHRDNQETSVTTLLRLDCLRIAALAGATMLTACGTVHRSAPTPAAIPAPAPAPQATPQVVPPAIRTPDPADTPAIVSRASNATTALAYRRDAAGHLYANNAERIYKGVMQPQLYAIGVLDVDIDRQGQVTSIVWRRAPTHAPEVMAEIVRTVRSAAPFPAPARLGKVTYTDTWLWDKSGKFQLDTLTEGQL